MPSADQMTNQNTAANKTPTGRCGDYSTTSKPNQDIKQMSRMEVTRHRLTAQDYRETNKNEHEAKRRDQSPGLPDQSVGQS